MWTTVNFHFIFLRRGLILHDNFVSGSDLSGHYGSGSWWVKSFGSGSATQILNSILTNIRKSFIICKKFHFFTSSEGDHDPQLDKHYICRYWLSCCFRIRIPTLDPDSQKLICVRNPLKKKLNGKRDIKRVGDPPKSPRTSGVAVSAT